MQQRGYRVSVWGPDGRQTTIQQLYSRQAPSSANNPPIAAGPSGPETAVDSTQQQASQYLGVSPAQSAELAKLQREEAAKAAKEEQLMVAHVHAESVAELERQMEFCVGISGGLEAVTLMPQFKAFDDAVYRQASQTEGSGLTTFLGLRYARGAILFEQSHTEGEWRPLARRGGETVRKFADKNDVKGLMSLLQKCNKESDELAARMGW
jgi:hypothetical protein